MEFLKTERLNMTCQFSNKYFQTSNTTSKKTPLIKIPFPPIISASDIVNKRKPSRITSKSPNAFLIYRKAFLDQFSLLNHNLRMTDVSKLVSAYWKNETEIVKDAYRKIAREVENELNEKRKTCVPYRVIWKNSKYSSARKRHHNGKVTKAQENKPESITSKFKATPSTCENVLYHFIPACPNEFTSNSSEKKNDKEVAPTFDSRDLLDSPESSQGLELNEPFNEFNEPFNEFNEPFNEFIEPFNEFIDYPACNENLGLDQSYLQIMDHSINFNGQPSESFLVQQDHFVFDGNIQENSFHELELDWYLQNFYLN